MTAPSDLAARLARLAAGGARAFDPPGFRFAEALLERARALGGGARDRLEARAAARLDLLEAALHRGRAAAEAALEELRRAGLDPPPEVRAALDLGDLSEAARAARRRLRRPPRPPSREITRPAWLTRLRDEAASSFRESLGSARAALAVARAVDRIPQTAGPYNPQAIAARALQAAEALSPAYVRALLEELDDLAALEATLGSTRTRQDRKLQEKKRAPRKSRT